MSRIILLMLISLSASAADISIGIATTHFQEGNFNNNNELVAIRDQGLFVATMINSYGQRTYAMGGYREWPIIHDVRAGVSYGGMYGYCAEAFEYGKRFNPTTCQQLLLPLVSPYIGWESRKYTVKLVNFGTAFTLTAGVKL